MKYLFVIGGLLGLLSACIKEKYEAEDCRREVYFVMEDVPYVFQGDEAVGFRPYYTFTESLDLFVFSDEKIDETKKYTYAYCRSHPVIPLETGIRKKEFLFVANLYDQKDMSWSFVEDKLRATFFIRQYEEPPVYLAAIRESLSCRDSLSVLLQMLVSHLNIRLINPPAQVVGLDVVVRDIAGSVTTDYQLGDTTHIRKQVFFTPTVENNYEFGVNTFPSYQDRAAVLSINLIGTEQTAPILVEDDRLHLYPGVITRLKIEFKTEQKITISVEIDGKWEIVDEGNIII